MVNKEYVWYASYGSNLYKERFMVYIQGGELNGIHYEGCTDKSEPQGDESITINHELYFAKNSPIWNYKGVAFINPTRDQTQKTAGRMYKITEEQFFEVVGQENRKQKIVIDLNKVIEFQGYSFGHSWYTYVIYIGLHKDGCPIFTFTCENLNTNFQPPDWSYLSIVIAGLIQTYPRWSNQQIFEYLYSKNGIVGKIMCDELKSRVDKAAIRD